MDSRAVGAAIGLLAVIAVAAALWRAAPEAAPDPATSDATRRDHADAGAALACPGCNLLLISIDTLRADRLGAYGHDRPTSPHLDALAARSLVFRDVLAQAPTTAPSHRSLLSGRYVFEHRNDTAELPVLAGMLQRAGYRTAAFVDGGQLNRRFGLSKGFETWFDTGATNEKGAHTGGGLEVINPEVLRWLAAPREEPFFAFVHTYDVHCPYTPPEPWRSMFTNGYRPDFEVEGRCGKHYFNELPLGPADFAYLSALYDGGVRYTDERLAEILDALPRLGLAENTVVVVTSDHGESLGERASVGHNEVYDVQLKVPLIFHLPGGPAAVVEHPVQSIDVLPTLLGVLGVPGPELPGIDLRGLLDLPAAPPRTRLAERGSAVAGSVRTDARFTLLMENGEPKALYDLDEDPDEERDLLGREPARAARLTEAYRALGARAERVPVYPEDLDEATKERLRALGYTP